LPSINLVKKTVKTLEEGKDLKDRMQQTIIGGVYEQWKDQLGLIQD